MVMVSENSDMVPVTELTNTHTKLSTGTVALLKDTTNCAPADELKFVPPVTTAVPAAFLVAANKTETEAVQAAGPLTTAANSVMVVPATLVYISV